MSKQRTRLLAVVALGLIVVLWMLNRALFQSKVDPGIAHYFAENLQFRRQALLLSAKRDEVVLRLPAPVCQYKIIQAVRSAVILKNRCTRCDFAITLVVESSEVYEFLESSKEAHAVFDNIVEIPSSSLAKTLLFVPKLPFVIYLDTRVISNHRFFPEALFDMLHKEYDMVMPIDGAATTSQSSKRVPAFSTNIIGFINSASVRRVLALWELNREQEISAVLLPVDATMQQFPDVKAFPLSMEWACPREVDNWVEGSHLPLTAFSPLTTNPCKSYVEDEHSNEHRLNDHKEKFAHSHWLKHEIIQVCS